MIKNCLTKKLSCQIKYLLICRTFRVMVYLMDVSFSYVFGHQESAYI